MQKVDVVGLFKLRLARAISDYIERSPLTQKELAEKFGISQSSVCRFWKMEMTGSIEKMVDIAEQIGYTVKMEVIKDAESEDATA